jgi:glutamine synthetase
MSLIDAFRSTLDDSSAGISGFAAHVGLADEARAESINRVLTTVADRQLETVRVGFVDPHGLVRSKSLTPVAFVTALKNGLDFSPGPFLFDTGLDLVGDPFSPGAGIGMFEMEGAADFVAVPDPSTFVVLPWAPTTGWVLATEYFKSGQPVPLSGRQVLRRLTDDLATQGMTFVIGLEVEWYLTKLTDQPLDFDDVGGFGRPGNYPAVSPVNLGYQFNSDQFSDALEEVLAPLRRHLVALGLPLRTLEHESGPGQIETTFGPMPALEAADAMVLFRTAVKQSLARRGYHATFMCKPGLTGADPSGWHLHQSLYRTADQTNLFMSTDTAHPVSETGRHFAGGLLRHARGASLFTTPTLNGYRRYEGEHALAPTCAGWSSDSRAAMLRVLASPNDASSHFENRSGEPAANPYLYIASQLVAGLSGMRTQANPGPLQHGGQSPTGRPLPVSLDEAVKCARGDEDLQAGLGKDLVNYIALLKENEIRRYEHAAEQKTVVANGVSEWEQREYFTSF